MFGMQIVESPAVGDAYEDWSGVRSPSRAVRRLKQGHPQNAVTRYKANGTVFVDEKNLRVYVHPQDVPELMEKLAASNIKGTSV